jgi:23S rRNA (adenine2503-C2)-methyltransferase
MTQPLAGLDDVELADRLKALGQPAYRAAQVLRWYYERLADSFEAMTDLPASLRAMLPEHFTPYQTQVARTLRDADGTIKLGIGLRDGHVVEAVMIPEGKRRTACVSTQAGCPVGCRFCASGARGFERNLDAHEIVEQVLHLSRALAKDERLTHLVFMGIGEGLLNLRGLLRAIRVLNAPWGLNLGARRMTVSTVGLRGTIEKLAAAGLQVNLAISLHAPDDELRRRLIPCDGLMRVDELIVAAEDYYEATGRETTWEYVLLGGVNDTPGHAKALAKKLRPCHATVNLIPYNEVEGSGFLKPTRSALKAFRGTLEGTGVRVTVRRRRGDEVHGACGQLRLDAKDQVGPQGTQRTTRPKA